ncbi:SfnB family sulfur acquisition oxidoreductase [Phytohabitans sp. ZYX-F-186]|uniref:SfnB family sulfur acquisition oxidoreductase n=1 Tax=Phytohabitans maris TaxID=3071409 RepID=A0ABU0ZKF0_9ACTN|nr:SfnB family sulfur acquisition oxidoreductase [Phytohabitans sp. ZYX-F-186]MDQ7907531.1 SfnB family sulfur acquisition oxidoreductase [Phytohabitans sp. ZYX-F-186]
MTAVIRDDAEAIAVARRLADRFAAGDAQRDAARVLPHAEVDELAATGLLAITVPAEDGGAGVSARTLGEVIEILSAGDASIGQIPQNHFFFVDVLRHAGTPEQRKFFHAELLAGKRFGNALSERGTATAHDFRIGFARRPDGSYIVDGTKYYATGSPFAHWIPIYALDAGRKLHAAWIPAGHSGVRVEDDWVGMGQRTTGSGTVRFDGVVVPPEHVVPVWRIFESTETFGAFGNYMHAAVDTGIAVAALRDGKDLIRTLARPWWEAEVERAADEPAVVQQFGELALLVRSARALLREAGAALDAARADLTEHSSAEASAAVAAARAQADTAALTVASEVFALVGTRSAAQELNLHRHWRNARTHTLHDPRRWKVRHLGQWELNDVPPPRNGII